MRPGLAIGVFLLGGVTLTLCDRMHIAYGVLEQADRSLAGQAAWVFPMFGSLSIGLVLAYGWLRRRLDEPAGEADARATVTSAAFALGAYASSGPLDELGAILALIFVALWLVRVTRRRSRCALIFSLGLAVVGPLGEAALSATGAFHYLHPDLGLVPAWLPGIYLHGGLLVAEVEAFVARPRADRHPSGTSR